MASEQTYDVYEFDAENGFYRRPGAEPFGYSDGQEEWLMLKTLREVGDKSVFSKDLNAHINSWVTMYHFSPLRSHLLRPFSNFFKGKKVLELGCGCGAMTRFMAECGAEITAVEGSPLRAAIARSRCSDLDGVSIYCDKILNIPFDPHSFDCVTLIGVLEYARMFGDGADPIMDTLALARHMLAPGGVLLLAIENQLGLKYLAGVSEDHAGKPMFGINDLYEEKSFVTFTRAELDEKLAQTGFGGRSLFVPLPDYKIVKALIHPAGLRAPKEEFDPTGIILKNMPMIGGTICFSLEQASRLMVRGGLTADLANSFLYVCAEKNGDDSIVDENILATHYGNFVVPEYAKEVVFRRKPGGVAVERRHLYAELAKTEGPYTQVVENEAFQTGPNMNDAIIRALNRPGWTAKDLAEAMRPWVDWLRSKGRVADGGRVMLPKEYMDAGPFNVVIGPKGPVFIDKEWSRDDDDEIGLEFVVFRTLFSGLGQIGTVAIPDGDKPEELLMPVIVKAMTLANVRMSKEQFDCCIKHTRDLTRQVFGSDPDKGHLYEQKFTFRPF